MKSFLLKIRNIGFMLMALGINISNAQLLDTAFNHTGIVITDIVSSIDYCNGVKIQSNGKIIAGGYYSTSSNSGASAIRLDSNGLMDNTFATSGKFTNSVGSGSNIFSGIQLDQNNNVVFCGYSSVSISENDAILLRSTNAGLLDNSFATGGIFQYAHANYLSNLYGITIQSDGKILAVGESEKSDFSTDSSFIIRLSSNGVLDASFGNNGKFSISNGVTLQSIATLPSGKIITIGIDNTGYIYIYQLNTNGSLDFTFNGSGIYSFYFGSNDGVAYSLAVQKDGGILVAGKSNSKFAIARILSTGILDNTFNTNGILSIDFFGQTSVANGVAVDTFATPNKIILAGYTYRGGSQDMAIARIALDGSVEAKGEISIGTGDSEATSVSIQPDSKIVMAGNANNQTLNQDFVVVRVLSNFANNVTGVLSPDLVSQNINLYPNPASQNVNVSSIYNIQQIKVVDILGNEIMSQNGFGNTLVNVSSLPKGLYNFVITTDKGTGSKKVSVQ
jgi:uncharacterized delta-60 repeat protein